MSIKNLSFYRLKFYLFLRYYNKKLVFINNFNIYLYNIYLKRKILNFNKNDTFFV